ncbi:MAG: GNAT family N-acetyltransferase [Candidatus Kapaibacterium sp.]
MSQITAYEYTPDNKQEWEDFVEQCINATLFHKQAFLDYHPDGRFTFAHIMFRDERNELIAVLPAGFFKGQDGVLWSPIGASYGGFVTKDIAFETALQVVDCFMEYCQTKGYKEAYVIPPPFIYSSVMNQHIEYAMLYRKFDFEYHYISHAAELKPIKEEMLPTFSVSARRNIRRAQREGELVVKETDTDAAYAEFHEILVLNKAKHNAKPTHSLDEMIRLRDLLPGKMKLFMVYRFGKPVAGAWMMLCNHNVALCFYIMMLYEYEHLHPNYFLLNTVTQWCADKGFRWMDIGVSQDTKSDNPMTPSLPLIAFKERFAARGILRSTYHFSF